MSMFVCVCVFVLFDLEKYIESSRQTHCDARNAFEQRAEDDAKSERRTERRDVSPRRSKQQVWRISIALTSFLVVVLVVATLRCASFVRSRRVVSGRLDAVSS